MLWLESKDIREILAGVMSLCSNTIFDLICSHFEVKHRKVGASAGKQRYKKGKS